MGRNHLRVLDLDPRFELVAVVDPEAKNLPSLNSDRPKLVRHLDELDSADFAVAVVATPTETHYEVVKALLEQNIHILVEKPAASTDEQSRRLVDLASSRGLRLAVGNVERCNPVVSALKDVLASGALGIPVHMSSTRAGGFPARVKEGNNVVLDLAVHDLDVLCMLLGPLKITNTVGHSTCLPGIFDMAEISVMSQEGLSGTVHVNWLTPQKIRQIRITGTEASCEVNYLTRSCEVFGKDLAAKLQALAIDWPVTSDTFCEVAQVPVPEAESLRLQLDQFARLLNGQTHGLAVGHELVESVRLASEALALLGEPVTQRFFAETPHWRPAFHGPSDAPLN
jgi:UDP-N-acetylglucosamine 3-dehydrogenase